MSLSRSRAVVLAASVALVSAAAACGSLKDAPSSSSSGGLPAGGGDDDAAPTTRDDGGGSGTDAGGTTGSDGSAISDASIDAGATKGPTGLDPGIPIPPLGNEPCSPPGNTEVCSGLQACRMATPDSGRCEDCSMQGTCSAGVGQACVGSNDCDILFNCFRGKCTLVCRFPYLGECGGTRACVDVGYQGYGLCDPKGL
ncbi:MAG: hypothetical protein JWP97_344 [Labilithrix sp.]|nr:hypothetical protein [Labilithrix sp.]